MTTEVPLLTTFADAKRCCGPTTPTRRLTHAGQICVRSWTILGSPQEKIRVVHVAGTAARRLHHYYAAALLRAAGLQVGLSVSPHVDQINERLQINGSQPCQKPRVLPGTH